MRIRAPPGREESMERTKDFYNGMNYAKKQLQQREHERRRRKRYFIKQKLCGIATFAVLVIATPFAPLLDLDIITISAFFMPIALSFTFSKENGIYELALTYPTKGHLAKYLENDAIIKAKANDEDNPQIFRIYNHAAGNRGTCRAAVTR